MKEKKTVANIKHVYAYTIKSLDSLNVKTILRNLSYFKSSELRGKHVRRFRLKQKPEYFFLVIVAKELEKLRCR